MSKPHQKSSAKAKAKRTAKAKAAQVSESLKKIKRDQAYQAFLENRHKLGYLFWVHHGLNFLASDYSSGLWEPLFPEIYEDKDIPPDALHKRVLDKFLDPGTNRLSEQGVRCILWASMKPQELFPLVWKIRAYSRKQGSDPHLSGDPYAWGAFEVTGGLMRQACKRWNDLKDHQWDYRQQVDSLIQDFLGVPWGSTSASDEASTHGSHVCSPGT